MSEMQERDKLGRFYLGHKCSQEARSKMSKAKKGQRLSAETRRKISEKLKGRIPKNLSLLHSPEITKKSAKARIDHPNYLKRQTVEARKKISATMKARYREGKIKFDYSKSHTPEINKRRSDTLKRYFRSREGKKARSAIMRRRWKDPIYKAKMAAMVRAKWQTAEYIQKVTKNRLKALKMKPNKKETILIKFFQDYGLPFKYVGDGQLTIKGRTPDFSDGNGKLIELFGEYWHEPEEEKDRIDFFRRHGYHCLVLWENELEKNNSLLQKITDFTEETNDG